MTIDFNSIIKEAHETAKSKGWWDKPRDIDTDIANCHCEMSEAFEEYRKGHGLDRIYYSIDDFGLNKPEGFTVELADLLIRIADTMGGRGWRYYETESRLNEGDSKVARFDRRIHTILEEEDLVDSNPDVTEVEHENFLYVIDLVSLFCEANNLPLVRALSEKMAYNLTRTYRNGGKLA